MTSAPASWISRAISPVRPAPPAAFSPLRITRSTLCSRLIAGRSAATAWRPGLPTTSDEARNRVCHEAVLVDALKEWIGDLLEPMPVGAGTGPEAASDVAELVKGDRHRVLRRDDPEFVHRVDEDPLAPVGREHVHR